MLGSLVGSLALPVSGQPSEPVFSSPTVESIDYGNGTVLTIVDYQNGTQDIISETTQTKTGKLHLTENAVNQSMSVTLPTSTEESTDWITATQDAVLEQEVLMGFTYLLTAKRQVGVSVLVAYLYAGIDVDIGFGVRLPVSIAIEYPEQMTVGNDYELYATLTPLDQPDYDEFLCMFKAVVWVEAGVFNPFTLSWLEYAVSGGPDYDWSRSFPTPLGPDMEFPIPPFEITVWDSASIIGFSLLKLNLIIDPQLGSDKITAKATATGDAAGEYNITWSIPDERIPFTVHADDYGPTDFAEIELSDFRYYFSIFKLHFGVKFDFHDWIDWLTGDPILWLFTLDMSWLTEELYLGVHQGTDGTVDVSVFVEKKDVRLVVIPVFQHIVPGDTGTYSVTVINTGNVPDTYDLSLGWPPDVGIDSSWITWDTSQDPVTLDPSQVETLTLRISPPLEVPLGDYPFNVTVTSQSHPSVLDSAGAVLTIGEAVPKLVVVAESPVNILVTAPNGFRVGYDSVTHSVVNEIEGATYYGPVTEPQVIIIPSPLQGVYIIDRVGTDIGPYTITIESVAEDGSEIQSQTWTGTTSPGEFERGSIQMFEDGSFVDAPRSVIPEVPWGTVMASAAMIIALVAYFAVPRWRRKRQNINL